MYDPRRDEEERNQYELQHGYEKSLELEKYQKAIQMCIAAGYLDKTKWDQALTFVGVKK